LPQGAIAPALLFPYFQANEAIFVDGGCRDENQYFY